MKVHIWERVLPGWLRKSPFSGVPDSPHLGVGCESPHSWVAGMAVFQGSLFSGFLLYRLRNVKTTYGTMWIGPFRRFEPNRLRKSTSELPGLLVWL